MVIAEVLNKIKDLEKQRRLVQIKLQENIFILPDLQEDEKPEALEVTLKEYEGLTEEIAKLKIEVIKVNLVTEVDIIDVASSKATLNLMEAIKLVETYRALEAQCTALSRQMASKNARFFNAQSYGMEASIKLIPNFKVTPKEMQDTALKFHEAARNIEQVVIKKNWQTEV
jgi:hypothetical protein